MATNPFDPLAGMGDDLSQSESQSFKNPVENEESLDAQKATRNSKVAGKHIRVTLLLLPELEKAIEMIADDNGLGKNETARWLLSLGLQQYYQEGKRPNIERVTASKVTLPDWQSKEE